MKWVMDKYRWILETILRSARQIWHSAYADAKRPGLLRKERRLPVSPGLAVSGLRCFMTFNLIHRPQ